MLHLRILMLFYFPVLLGSSLLFSPNSSLSCCSCFQMVTLNFFLFAHNLPAKHCCIPKAQLSAQQPTTEETKTYQDRATTPKGKKEEPQRDGQEEQTSVCVPPLTCVGLVIPRTAACQAPLSVGFSRQEYQSGLPFPPSGKRPDPGIQPVSPA